jgi:hypothetical protein
MRQRPVVIVNPRDDTAFGDLVDELVGNGAQTTDGLEIGLRHRYPLASVHAREISAERIVVWYVYRDGRWVRPGGVARGGGDV